MLKIIIIDDENESIQLLTSLLSEYCQEVLVVATSNSPSEGIQLLREHSPDLLFLDISMPGLSGFDLLKAIPERSFEVIFVTAHNDRALEAFRASAIDYLLKPISILDLFNAVEKVKKRKLQPVKEDNRIDTLLQKYESLSDRKVGFSTSDGIEYLNLSEIVQVKAETSYSHIFISDKKPLMVSKNLSEVEELIKDNNFFRVHRSHLINIRHVVKYHSGGYVEMSDGSKAEVSRRKKEEFLEFLAHTIL